MTLRPMLGILVILLVIYVKIWWIPWGARPMGLAAATLGQVAKNNYQNYQQYQARQLVTQVITRGAPDREA